jgi:8-oxo-dGTP pyrophosphatase MutT (NUDIX family)
MTDWPAPGWTVFGIAPTLGVIAARDMPALSPALDAEVERLWMIAQARTGNTLFNGRVFTADDIAVDALQGHWTEFRRVVAQMERPDLYDALRLRPTATGGVLICAAGMVFGRRPAGAIYQPGMWQLPPAGSIDPSACRADGSVDVIGNVLMELEEEIGLRRAAISRTQLLCLVEHAGSHVLDLGIAIWTSLDADGIRTAHAEHGNREYEDLVFVPIAELPAAVTAMGPALTPQALAFLYNRGLHGDLPTLREAFVPQR